MATVPIGKLVYGVGEVETGHIEKMADRYTVVNSIGAHGRYQVMRQYIGPWTKEAFGRAYTPAEFLKSPKAQDALARYRLARDQKKYGDWRAAAAVWFSGRPDWGSSASDGGNTVAQYVAKVRKAMAGGGSVGGGTDTAPGGAGGDFLDGLTGGVLGPLKGIAQSTQSIGQSMLSVGEVAEFLLKLALPPTWVRIVCGLFGGGFLIFGLVVLGREAKGT